MTFDPPRATAGPSEPAGGAPDRAGGGDGSADNRRIHRVPCRIAVSQQGRSAPLGRTRDLSLDGLFVDTDQPLPVGAVLPLALELDEAGQELRVSAEVVRRTSDGMGLRFLAMKRKERKRLKRYVGELNSVDSSRETASRLLNVAERAIEPITDGEAIRQLLERTRRLGVRLKLIPRDRQLREEAALQGLDGDRLVLRGDRPSALRHDEAVLVLHTLEFVSYSFQAQVARVSGRRVELSLPELVVYSERRATDRVQVGTDAWLVLEPAWKDGPKQRWKVLEVSGSGLSFQAEPQGFQLRIGTPLDGAALVRGGREDRLEAARVRHITPAADGSLLKVGVEHGARRAVPAVIRSTATRPGPLRRLGGWLTAQISKVSFLKHQRALEQAPADAGPIEVVRIGSGDDELVGLLNTTDAEAEGLRCPVVVVAPGFAGRKEQMSGLALTLVDTFARNHQDVAVLRFDGSNNLGESWKSPGCQEEGSHTLGYTVSGAVRDIDRALEWVRGTDRLEATSVVLVSVSFSSVPVRHFLASRDDHGVDLWVSYMGAADARDSVHHVSGHLDLFENAARGQANGQVTLLGCLADADLFFDDLRRLGIGTLEDARAEMARVSSDVFWIVGRHDAFMDPRRAHDLMTVEASGARELMEVDAGHIPRSSGQAVEQFRLISERVFAQAHGIRGMAPAPSLGWLGAVSAVEWDRVRRPAIDRSAWWARYLLGEGGPGFDVLDLSPRYRSFVELQARLLEPAGQRVLELGAGTGNLSRLIAGSEPASFVCTDLVPDVVDIIRSKVGPDVEVATVDADGSPRSAMSRWIRGDLPGLPALARRLPGLHPDRVRRLMDRYTPPLHAALLGRPVDVGRVVDELDLDPGDADVVQDLALLARVAAGTEDVEQARDRLRRLPGACLDGTTGLPWPDGRFDRVVLSLVLSYLRSPEDLVREVHRVLAPGGMLVVSSMRPDADSSRIFLELVDWLMEAPQDELPAGMDREELLRGARSFMGDASDLMRMEEEGLFRFFGGQELVDLVLQAGFSQPELHREFGDPPQAVVVRCRRT